MTRRLVLTYLLVTAFVLAIVGVPFGVALVRMERDRLRNAIERDATVLSTYVENDLEDATGRDLQPIALEYARRYGGRAVITDARGIAIADSDPGQGEVGRDFSTRPEIAAALRGARQSGSRFSSTLGEGLSYAAVPVASSGIVYGAVRLSYPTTEIDRTVRGRLLALGATGLVALAAASLVSVLLARWITRPIRKLEDATAALAAGRLDTRSAIRNGPPEVRHLSSEFDQMAERLHELVRTQRAFVADASHQLRTPLAALRLRLEQLETSVEPGSDAEVNLEAAREETQRLSRLVDGLLTLARAEGRRPERTVVDLHALCTARVELWEPFAAERAVSLVADLPPADGIAVYEVPGAIEQVLDNLVANAIDVAPIGSTVTVRLTRSTRPDGAYEVHVVDAGPGLSADDRQRAFDRFWRGPALTEGGSGLGLAIVKQLTVASGGGARLDAAPDRGLDAVVWFPPAPVRGDAPVPARALARTRRGDSA